MVTSSRGVGLGAFRGGRGRIYRSGPGWCLCLSRFALTTNVIGQEACQKRATARRRRWRVPGESVPPEVKTRISWLCVHVVFWAIRCVCRRGSGLEPHCLRRYMGAMAPFLPSGFVTTQWLSLRSTWWHSGRVPIPRPATWPHRVDPRVHGCAAVMAAVRKPYDARAFTLVFGGLPDAHMGTRQPVGGGGLA